MTETIISVLGLLGISNIITFVLTKRKYNTEVDSQQIKNMDESFEIYKKVMNESLNTQNEKIALLQKENDSLRQQVNKLQEQVISLVGMLEGGKPFPSQGNVEPLAMKDM